MLVITYGSVCSGIEACSVAWQGLGWKAAWYAEIEKFPAAVLAERWPGVPNLGDMTLIADAIRAGCVMAPDVLVGGTPCQSFSVAGLGLGLSDKRGQLTLAYVELANAIDQKRREFGKPEAIIVWENVPGVLSSKDNAFGCFLAGLAGGNEVIEPGCRPATGKSSRYWRWNPKTRKHVAKWPLRGCVFGQQRTVAWIVKDAQYYGVAQRRRRVFVVASARDGFDPCSVLFESDGMRRDFAPRRSEGQEVAGTLKARANSGGWSEDVDMAAGGYMQVMGSHWDNHANPHPTLNQSHNPGGIGMSDQEIFSQRGAGLVYPYRMIAFGLYVADNTASTIKARDSKDATDLAVHSTDGDINKISYALASNTINRPPDEGGNGTGFSENLCYTLTKTDRHGVSSGVSVRRLMPVECEMLQGFPRDYTQIPWRGKRADACPDGPRYQAIGNSMAVPVMRWIGERIATVMNTIPEVRNG